MCEIKKSKNAAKIRNIIDSYGEGLYLKDYIKEKGRLLIRYIDSGCADNELISKIEKESKTYKGDAPPNLFGYIFEANLYNFLKNHSYFHVSRGSTSKKKGGPEFCVKYKRNKDAIESCFFIEAIAIRPDNEKALAECYLNNEDSTGGWVINANVRAVFSKAFINKRLQIKKYAANCDRPIVLAYSLIRMQKEIKTMSCGPSFQEDTVKSVFGHGQESVLLNLNTNETKTLLETDYYNGEFGKTTCGFFRKDKPEYNCFSAVMIEENPDTFRLIHNPFADHKLPYKVFDGIYRETILKDGRPEDIYV